MKTRLPYFALSGFLIFCISALSAAFALEPTPLRISVRSKESPCWKETTTIGLDLGLLRASTCKVIGAQFSPFAAVGNIYGIQFGLLEAAAKRKIYGIQFAGLSASTNWSDNRYTVYGLQLAGLLNNFSFDQTEIRIAGIQAAGLVNMAGYVTGLQLSLLNDSRTITGVQAGAVNLLVDGTYASRGVQIGLYNKAGKISGLQFGIVNEANDLAGVQIGLINIVSKEHRKLDFPFIPILNVSW